MSPWRRSVIPLDSIIIFFKNTRRQNLRDEVAMDVDEEEDGENGATQHPKSVHDYGIEVDFEVLGGEEREVSDPRPHADDYIE